jgi:hypothetical protein
VALPIEEGLGDPEPPDTFPYQFRTARLVWQCRAERDLSRRTVAYYRSLYEDDSPGWQASRRALRRVVERCREEGVPCYVLLFPLLHELNDDYPFLDVHAKVRAEVEGAGGKCLDLFPEFKGRRAKELWVHPADHHPNEQVARVAAEVLCRELTRDAAWPQIIDRARQGRH